MTKRFQRVGPTVSVDVIYFVAAFFGKAFTLPGPGESGGGRGGGGRGLAFCSGP